MSPVYGEHPHDNNVLIVFHIPSHIALSIAVDTNPSLVIRSRPHEGRYSEANALHSKSVWITSKHFPLYAVGNSSHLSGTFPASRKGLFPCICHYIFSHTPIVCRRLNDKSREITTSKTTRASIHCYTFET
jgi:hypothetical protein